MKTSEGAEVFAQSRFEFGFYPPNGELLKINILGSLWYHIPSNFPLNVTSRKAIDMASDYLRNMLKTDVATFTNPFGQPVLFVVIQDHLYYLVTLYNSSSGYEVIVNPRTGEVGMPTSR
ncbi:MAG: hypothetical protein ACUVQ8_08460 [Nitrososphaeria archaeon]